jgi:putative Holliday junction resolvase
MELSNVLAFDYGEARVGLAIAAGGLAVARPLVALANDDKLWASIQMYIDDNNINQLVVGLPRNLDGEETAQTRVAKEFATELQKRTGLPVDYQDEALTSVTAQEILSNSNRNHKKGEVDALAASLILSDYISGKGN